MLAEEEAPSPEEAVQLRMPRQQPLLETESVDVDRDGHPVTYATTCFRADRLQFVVPT
jgi:DNA-binding GntR family transcriptional regulator